MGQLQCIFFFGLKQSSTVTVQLCSTYNIWIALNSVPSQLLGEQAELLSPVEGLRVGECGTCLGHLQCIRIKPQNERCKLIVSPISCATTLALATILYTGTGDFSGEVSAFREGKDALSQIEFPTRCSSSSH